MATLFRLWPVFRGLSRTDNYTAHFGEQWKRYRLTQLDSYTGKPITSDRMRRWFGDLWPALATGNVLECGCGAGRFTEILLKAGERVTSVDLSDAVRRMLNRFQSTIPIELHRQIFFRFRLRGSVRFRVRLGIIQHTPSSERTIAALYEHVCPGGWLIVDHKRREIFRSHTKTCTHSSSHFEAYVHGNVPCA